jgi:hypothetical protein
MTKRNEEIVLSKAIAAVLKSSAACWKERLGQLEEEAAVIRKLRNKIPEAWVPLRLAVSCYLTQGAQVDNLKFPLTQKDWLEAWEEIRPRAGESRSKLQKRFQEWLETRGNHRFAVRLSEAYAAYWHDKKFDTAESLKDFHRLQKISNDKDAVMSFWKEYKQVGIEYSKNIPMDEKDPLFLHSIKVDSRIKSIVKTITEVNMKNEEIEQIFLNAGNANGLNGWETDRFCFQFSGQIKRKIREING